MAHTGISSIVPKMWKCAKGTTAADGSLRRRHRSGQQKLCYVMGSYPFRCGWDSCDFAKIKELPRTSYVDRHVPREKMILTGLPWGMHITPTEPATQSAWRRPHERILEILKVYNGQAMSKTNSLSTTVMHARILDSFHHIKYSSSAVHFNMHRLCLEVLKWTWNLRVKALAIVIPHTRGIGLSVQLSVRTVMSRRRVCSQTKPNKRGADVSILCKWECSSYATKAQSDTGQHIETSWIPFLTSVDGISSRR